MKSDELHDYVKGFFAEYRALVEQMDEGLKPGQTAPVPSDRVLDLLAAGRSEEAWPIVAALVEAAPDRAPLGFVAAGVLEETLFDHSSQVGREILSHARRSPTMRTALRMVWGWERMPDPLRSEFLELLKD